MTALFAVLMTGVVWFLGPGRSGEGPGAAHERRLPPEAVEVCVGPVGSGLEGVLAPVLADPVPDGEHAARLNEQLGLRDGARLGFARLVVANPTAEPRSLQLDDGLVRVHVRGGGVAENRSLQRRVEAGELELPGGLAFALRVLGPLRDRVEVPAGASVALLIAFSDALDLAQVERVEWADGAPWSARQKTQAELRRLLVGHDAAIVKEAWR